MNTGLKRLFISVGGAALFAAMTHAPEDTPVKPEAGDQTYLQEQLKSNPDCRRTDHGPIISAPLDCTPQN